MRKKRHKRHSINNQRVKWVKICHHIPIIVINRVEMCWDVGLYTILREHPPIRKRFFFARGLAASTSSLGFFGDFPSTHTHTITRAHAHDHTRLGTRSHAPRHTRTCTIPRAHAQALIRAGKRNLHLIKEPKPKRNQSQKGTKANQNIW